MLFAVPSDLGDPTDGADTPRARLELVQLEEKVGFLGIVVVSFDLQAICSGDSLGIIHHISCSSPCSSDAGAAVKSYGIQCSSFVRCDGLSSPSWAYHTITLQT